MTNDLHPHCAVTVVVIPLDAEGRPRAENTVTLAGIAATISIDPDELRVRWREDRATGLKFTIAGPGALL
jgi:hypothetical protein